MRFFNLSVVILFESLMSRFNSIERAVQRAKEHFASEGFILHGVQLEEVASGDVLFSFRSDLKPVELRAYARSIGIKVREQSHEKIAEDVIEYLKTALRSKVMLRPPKYQEINGNYRFVFPVYFNRAHLFTSADNRLLTEWHKSHLAIRNHMRRLEDHLTDVSDASGNFPLHLDALHPVAHNFEPESHSLIASLADHYLRFRQISKDLTPNYVFSPHKQH